MQLTKPSELLRLPVGEHISKRNLFDLIQYSKVKNSKYWEGPHLVVGNTPQQGINWIGVVPRTQAVLIKTRIGSYEMDGWVGADRNAFNYSFKASKGEINQTEMANRVLINQPLYLYPVILFTESGREWKNEGQFDVASIAERFVTLERRSSSSISASPEDYLFTEGDRRYAMHLVIERNRKAIELLKAAHTSECQICRVDFAKVYGFEYIEAHHKTEISSFSGEHALSLSDLALLCPNCHKAVHLHMREYGTGYDQIEATLKRAMCL
ncbi:putative restriction endonuclease [Opitutaceae bacterium TAV1]|nr:putative restriction endonuclease [Opitutaceae bacterium TAV1]